MQLNDYQAQALTTDTYDKDGGMVPVTDLAFINKVLGLTGESGEVAEKIKKILRNNDGVMSEVDRRELIKELGDVLWYLATMARYLGEDLETVAKVNLEKLADRKKRGAIKSAGDNR